MLVARIVPSVNVESIKPDTDTIQKDTLKVLVDWRTGSPILITSIWRAYGGSRIPRPRDLIHPG